MSYPRSIDDVQMDIHKWAKRKGWWELPAKLQELVDGDDEIAQWVGTHVIAAKLLLVVSEVCEAFEELRNGHSIIETYEHEGKPEGFGIELADAGIRLLDLAEWCKLNTEQMMRIKMAYNDTREHKHGGKLV